MLVLSTVLTVVSSGAAPPPDEDICQLPKTTGPCRAMMERFFYNGQTMRCEAFIYGGCLGNANNFKTLRDCHDTCGGNATSHFKGAHCNEGPLLDGSSNECRGAFPRVWFNPQTMECENYLYGGCNQGPNLYITMQECKTACIHGSELFFSPRPRSLQMSGVRSSSLPSTLIKVPEGKDVCSLPPVFPSASSCSLHVTRWTYNQRLKRCMTFIYGGCGGTPNLFKSRELCQSTCEPNLDVCSQRMTSGPCRGYKKRFGFNQDTQRCEPFIYGGCQGNDNNFATLEDCVNTCGGSDPATDSTCSLVACDRAEIEINRAKGCRPILKPGECCPSSWDCLVWTERLNRSQECFVVSEDAPNGNYYQLGQSVPGMFPGCRSNCSCTKGVDGTASVECGRHECPTEMLDPEAYQDEDGHICVNVQYRTDCYPSYSEVPFKCKLGSSMYVDGQTFHLPGEPCQVCTCQEGWNNTGTLEDNTEHCEPFHCPVSISHQSKLVQGCVPVYSEQRCGCPGPGDWICPGSLIQRNFLTPPMEVYPEYLEPRKEATNTALIVDRPRSDVCLLPAAEGQHEDSKERWFFHSATGSCRKFQSGTALDEPNNLFNNEEQCQMVCKQYLEPNSKELEPLGDFPSENPICNGPVSVGLCAGRLMRYYYDKTSGTCRQFYYGGCGALPNTFLTLEECNGKCNTTSQGRSLPDETQDVCSLPKMTGPCKAAIPSYYFDNDTQSCLPFIYGGCGGNGNRFQTLKGCTDRCQVDNEVQHRGRDFCKLESDTGMCKAAFLRWHHDHVSGECRQFIWGGCGGNKNNFETKAECKVVCSFIPDQEQVPMARSAAKVVQDTYVIMPEGHDEGQDIDVCLQPKMVGICRALFPRYYFNSESGMCEFFNYGGCGGNGNNFETIEECNEKCDHVKGISSNLVNSAFQGRGMMLGGESEDDCGEPAEAGPCLAFLPKFHFDAETQSCKPFIYGGCGGNGNRFDSEESCLRKCNPSAAQPEAAPTCQFGDEHYIVGDVIRSRNQPCYSCTCSSPPNLTCKIRTCDLYSNGNFTQEGCEPVYDEHGCCITSFKCS